ncbi:MAG TPA: glutathione S-transferase N-terminal domain-containing protein [Steroidobacteraceae bacterium]|jgi:glutathione S-transferase
MSRLQIVGRRSSVFTRMPLIFAEEFGVPYEVVPIYDMTAVGPEVYAGNPALKLPILRKDGDVLFGAQNICRAIVEAAGSPKRVVWPEELNDTLSRNAQELVWHAMTTQVQIVMGTVVNKLPADSPYFVKAHTSLGASLSWLDSHLPELLETLPPRDLSLFEVSLHCLIEHLVFRPTLQVSPYLSLMQFSQEFSGRQSAHATLYRFDPPPASGH